MALILFTVRVPPVPNLHLAPGVFLENNEWNLPRLLDNRTNSFDMDFGNAMCCADQFEIDLLGFDPSMITQEDRAAILNGVVLSGEFNSSSLIDWMEDQLPRADVTLEIILPDYIRSTEGNPEPFNSTHHWQSSGSIDFHYRCATLRLASCHCRGSDCGLNSLDRFVVRISVLVLG